MTVGDGIKRAAQATKNVTEKVVDVVEAKVNDVTDAVEGSIHTVGEKIHRAVGRDEAEK